MKRRSFIEKVAVGTGAVGSLTGITSQTSSAKPLTKRNIGEESLEADVVIAGGGLGGCAAAFAALRNGLTVIMTEETDWIGGQLTQQGVPPDEHRWIETHGATQLYRDLRNGIRRFYRDHYPLTGEARSRTDLNPGDGAVRSEERRVGKECRCRGAPGHWRRKVK